jgi:hypothetical protein
MSAEAAANDTFLAGDGNLGAAILGDLAEMQAEPPKEKQQPEPPKQKAAPKEDTQSDKTSDKKAEENAETKATTSKEAKADSDKTTATTAPKETAKTETTDESAEDDALPNNPHFEDKDVADKPEGDDSEKGIRTWKEVKAELRKAREDRDAIALKLQAAEEAASKVSEQEVVALKEQFEELRLRNTEVERELKAARFEKTPEYTSRVTKPIESMQSDINTIAEEAEIDAGKLWRAVTEPDIKKRKEAFNQLFAGMNEADKIEVVQIAKRYQDVAKFKDEFSKDAEKILEAERAKVAEREQKFGEEQRRAQQLFAKRTWEELQEKHPFLREVDGHEEWNTAVRKARQAVATVDLDGMETEKRTSILAKAAAVPFMERAIAHYKEQLTKVGQAKDARISELEKQLAAFQEASPKIGGSTEERRTVSDDDDDIAKNPSNLGRSILSGI